MQLKPRRGRPPETDSAQVVRVALGLFERRGFDRVTMDDIAKAAKVSRRTLFRHFPTKGELIWEGLSDIGEAVKLGAAEVNSSKLSLSEALRGIFEPILQALDEPEFGALARRRLRLIARTPELLSHPTLGEIEAVVAESIARRSRRGAPPAALVAKSLVASAFAALVWWAEHGDEMSALEATRSVLRELSSAAW